MATADGTFLCIGTYGSETAARADYAVGKDLHTDGIVGTSDAAVVTKDEMATRHGGWGGAAAGAVIGILFPPAIIGGPGSHLRNQLRFCR